MTTGDVLERLSDIVGRMEGERTTVEDVSISRATDDEFVVDFSLRLPATSAESPDGRYRGASDASRAAGGRSTGTADGDPSRTVANGSSPEFDGGVDATAGSDSWAAPTFHGTTGSVAAPQAVPGLATGDTETAETGATTDVDDGEAPEVETGQAGEPSEIEAGEATAVEAGDIADADAAEPSGSEELPESEDTGVSRTADGADDATGSVECRVSSCDETFDTDHGMKIHAAKAHDGEAERPPHRDPERLRSAYESWDTFEAMTEALGTDVTAQTVRRNMMSLGIHDPDGEDDDGAETPSDPERGEDADDTQSVGVGRHEEDRDDSADPEIDQPERAEDGVDADCGDDSGTDGGAPDDLEDANTDDGVSTDEADRRDVADAEASVATEGAATAETDRDVLADTGSLSGVVTPELREAVPAEVEAETLVGAVREAKTLYEVQQALGMERDAVKSLLSELGLLELVHGRVATKAVRDDRKNEVERRLLEQAGEA